MTSINNHWAYSGDPDDLSRYHKDANDLSVSIDAGQKISDLRELAGLSVENFSRACDVTEQELLALEAGIMTLQPDLAERIAQQLGVDRSFFYLSDVDYT